MFLTIICACGQQNSIHERDLESAVCSRCDGLLLRPSAPEPHQVKRSEPVQLRLSAAPVAIAR